MIKKHCPGIIIAALRGGSGKTIFSVGLITVLANLKKRIAPFKKGPDYIDAGWLALAAGRPCYNLDTFLIDQDTILDSFYSHTFDTDFSIIEGNRGLYDCIDTDGKTSTAELAKLLDYPVILCIDATKTTRTMAAVVSGIAAFDPDVKIGGVVLNRVAGPRHQNILTRSIEDHCGIPILGAVPKLTTQRFPERHMGLVPTHEHKWAKDAIHAIGDVAKAHLDIDGIIAVAEKAAGIKPPPKNTAYGKHNVETTTVPSPQIQTANETSQPMIGVLRDAAFQFYYPENLEALREKGAKIVFTSPLTETDLPDVDALYIGGGFPETHAKALSENKGFRSAIKALAERGMPIYAECGGLMYLGKDLVLKGRSYAMTGVLPVTFGFSKKPQGHGYTIVSIEKENPYFEKGSTILGHEFHYSSVIKWEGSDGDLAFTMERGTGFWKGKDGVCHKNVLATYSHIHALGTPQWATAMVTNAMRFNKKKKGEKDP